MWFLRDKWCEKKKKNAGWSECLVCQLPVNVFTFRPKTPSDTSMVHASLKEVSAILHPRRHVEVGIYITLYRIRTFEKVPWFPTYRDESSSFTRLCQLLCLCSPNKEGLSSRTSGPHKATPEDDNKRNKRQPKHDENEAVVTTEPLLSPLTANTQRPYPHGPRKLFSLSRRSSKRFGEIDQSTVLCCSSKPPSVGQVDLCPRPWYGQNYPGEDESHQARQHFQTEQTDGTLDEHSCQVQICDILWRTLFFMTCLPLCYACYFSRTIRRRRKITQAEYILTRSNQQLHARNQSRTKSKLVAEGQDIMGQTMFHQMKQAKSSLKEKITTLPRQPEELTRPDDQGVVEPEESLGLSNDSNHSRPQEEDASPTKVIKLNVIVLHSTSSLLIHKPLISELGIAPSSSYLQGSQCDGLPKGHAVAAGTSLEMSGTRFLEVPGAKASSIRRLTVLPNAPYTRNGGHHGDNSGLDGLDGRLTETVVVSHHGGNSVRFLSQEKLSTVVEDEPPDETSVLNHAETIESSTRRSSSSVSEQFFECTDSIPSTPITSPEDELQLPSIVRSTSQIEEEVVTFRSNVQETKRDHRTNWKKVSAVFRWKAIGAHMGKTLEIGETVPDGSSDIGEPLLDPRVSTNSSERSASSEKIPASRLSLLPVKMGQDNSGSSDSVQLRAKEAKPRTKRKSNSGQVICISNSFYAILTIYSTYNEWMLEERSGKAICHFGRFPTNPNGKLPLRFKLLFKFHFQTRHIVLRKLMYSASTAFVF